MAAQEAERSPGAVDVTAVANIEHADSVQLVIDAVDHAVSAPAGSVSVLQRRTKSLTHPVRVVQ